MEDPTLALPAFVWWYMAKLRVAFSELCGHFFSLPISSARYCTFVHTAVLSMFSTCSPFFFIFNLSFFFLLIPAFSCVFACVCVWASFISKPSSFTQELAALLLVPRLRRVGLGRLTAGRQNLFSVRSLLWKRLHIKLFRMCMFNYILHQPSFLSCRKVTVSAALIELQVFFYYYYWALWMCLLSGVSS